MKNAAVAGVNLVTLLIGIAIGFALAQSPAARVYASGQLQQQFEEITPVVTAPSAGFGVVLSGRMATDEVTVRGMDLVKLHEGTLNLLAAKGSLGLGMISRADVQAVIDSARVARPLRMKEPERPREPEKPKEVKK